MAAPITVDLAGVRLIIERFAVEFGPDDESIPGRWSVTGQDAQRKPEPRRKNSREVRETVFRFVHPAGHVLDVTVRRRSDERLTLRARFRNVGASAIRLRRFVLLDASPSSIRYDGPASAWWLGSPSTHTRRVGNLAQVLKSEAEIAEDAKRKSVWGYLGRAHFSDGDPRRHDGRWRAFHDALTLYRDEDNGVVIGATGKPVADVRLNVHVGPDSLGLEVTSEMDDVLVEPGETGESQEISFIAGPYRVALAALYDDVAAGHGARPPRPVPTGWCSWYGPYIEVSRDAVERVCRGVEALAPKLRPDVIQIDDKWQVAYGDWRANERFPLGMKEVAARIRRTGATPGIWMAAVRAIGKPDAWYQGASNGNIPDERAYLDPTHPEVQEFILRSVRERVAEGFRYFKFDFNHLDRGRLHDRRMTRVQALRHLFALLREAVGESSYILACVGDVERSVCGFADATRIGSDTCHPGAPGRLCDGLPANPMNLSECARATGQSALANGRLFANDPDVIMVGPEHKGFMSYVGLLGGLAFNSKPLDALKDVELRILERFQPIGPERGYSLAGGTDPWHRLFGFVSEGPSGTFAAVSWYNNSEVAQRAVVDAPSLRALGLCHAWDLWTERYLGVRRCHALRATIDPHGGGQWRLTQAKDESAPLLIGSNLHMTMGAAEVAAMAVTKREVSLDLRGEVGARDGRIYFYSRSPLTLKACRGADAVLARCSARVYVLALTNRSVAHQRVQLAIGGVAPPRLPALLNEPSFADRFASTAFLSPSRNVTA